MGSPLPPETGLTLGGLAALVFSIGKTVQFIKRTGDSDYQAFREAQRIHTQELAALRRTSEQVGEISARALQLLVEHDQRLIEHSRHTSEAIEKMERSRWEDEMRHKLRAEIEHELRKEREE